jgi:hypothetical protein
VVVARFEPVAAEAFEVFLERRCDAERAGYPYSREARVT